MISRFPDSSVTPARMARQSSTSRRAQRGADTTLNGSILAPVLPSPESAHSTMNETTTLTAVMGQDWTPFSSSTLPNMLESTGLGISFGDIYERAPQFRSGYTHDFGRFQLMPEIAVVLPAVGLTPSAANLSNQLG